MKTIQHFALLLPIAGMAFILPSCSSDDENGVELPVDHQVISFTAIAEKAPRATETTTASLKSFKLYSFTDGKPYRENVTVVKNGGSWTYDPPMYWPSTPINFFAFSPDISCSTSLADDGSGRIDDYSNDGQTDFLYAVTMDQSIKPTPVMLNFRHAMSKVSVMLSSSNEQIKVHVAHVSLCNVNMSGDFEFPRTTTSNEDPLATGSWSDQSKPLSPLIFYAHEPSDDLILTKDPIDVSENTLDIAYMIPQQLNETVLNGNSYTGNFIKVDCMIYDSKSGAQLWPNSTTPPSQTLDQSNYGSLIFPMASANVQAWKAGCAYVYNIRIDNPDELGTIDFDITVDQYN